MPSPSFSRLALVASLAISSLLLHSACARSVSSEPEVDSLGLFAPDSGQTASEQQGLCVSTKCPAPFATCPGESGLCTTNLTNDTGHCGSCDAHCPHRASNAGFVCSGGQCKLACDQLTADCNHEIADGCETLTDSDPANCGGCGKTCKAGDLCWRGACGCPNGYTACGTECVRLDSDDLNCSSCGNVCHAPSNDADPAWRCGAHVEPAHTKWTCLTSACELTCKPGWGDCNNNFCADGCELDLLNNPDNCGACGHKCDAGQACVMGSCLCPAGLTNCNGECVDLQADPAHCGSCGGRCPGPSGSNPRKPTSGGPVCTGGECSYVCFPGFADCDGDPDNGCEANLNTNPRHCGRCETACNLGADQPCVVGKCLTRQCDAGVLH